MINNLKKSDTWKILLTIRNKSVSSIGYDDKRVTHSKSDNIEITGNDTKSNRVKNRYKNNLEPIKGSEFVFNYIHLLCYQCHKVNSNSGGSYIDSPDWIKNVKATINPTNKKDKKRFEYSVTFCFVSAKSSILIYEGSLYHTR